MISRVPVTTNGAIGDSIYVGLLAPRAPTDPEFGLPCIQHAIRTGASGLRGQAFRV